MDLETALQSEVSQKEKNKYRILTHTYGVQKYGTDETICKAGIKIQTQGTDVWAAGEGEGGTNQESTTTCETDTGGKLLSNTGSSAQCSVMTWRGGMENAGERRAQEEGARCILIANSHCCTAETNTAL